MSVDDEVTLGSIAGRLFAVFALVLLNAFFVASEFALVGSRASKLAEMAGRGDRLARVAQSAVAHLDRYLSATQLGITIASIALGWIGEPAIAALVDALLVRLGLHAPSAVTHTAAGVTVAFVVITFLHVVYGELAPKSVALVMPERLSGLVALPLMLFTKVMTPFIALLNGTANATLRLFGIRPVSELEEIHSPHELRLLITQANARGTLSEGDSAMLAGVFDFREKRARDVMRPRTEVVALPIKATKREVWDVVRREQYSRYPVYGDTLDDVAGVFLVKDLWLREEEGTFSLASLMREPLYIPASRPAERVLDDLRKTRAQMAVVLDEYGGTAGIITAEDLIEEVMGDIADEYDVLAREAIMTEDVLELDASLSLVDVRSDHQLPIPQGEWTTLGGYVFGRVGRIPRIGDRVPFPGGELEVVAMDRRRVAAVRVLRPRRTESATPTPRPGGDS